MGGDASVFGRRQARDHERAEGKLRRRIKRLKVEVLTTKASVEREKACIRRTDEVMLAKLRGANDLLRRALEAAETTLGPEALLRLEALSGGGFWRRLWWAVGFAVTGRIVRDG